MTLCELRTLERELCACTHSTLEGLQQSPQQTTTKADGSLVTASDNAMQEAIGNLLADLTPALALAPLLSEEMSPAEQQAALSHGGPCWVLDPIDGTSNFASGLPFYCVSLALVENGMAQLGVVYDPCRRECFSALRHGGAWLNGHPLHTPAAPPLQKAIGIIDLKRLTPTLAHGLVDAPPFHSMRNLGAVALEWCWLAAGRGQIYLHGKQQLWDYAAAQLILREAGGQALDLQGKPPEPLFLGSRAMIGASDARLFSSWHHWVQAHWNPPAQEPNH